MSSDYAISAKELGKCYTIYKRPQHRLKQMLVGTGASHGQFWALRNVDFNIRHGETVGIIGGNGAGKSTLLQIICGTLTPTTGKVAVEGRVAALLELGAGFNPEFSGRENVYISATVAGYSHSEIVERFDQIADFADIGDFMDQPVKTYSSGMYARLAFAVAINIDPDILILDEVLAVGDESFQRKCYARIEQIKRNGATILFVSHAAGTIVELCDRAILFHNGERLFTGEAKEAVFFHQKLGNAEASDAPGIIEKIRSADVAAAEQELAPLRRWAAAPVLESADAPAVVESAAALAGSAAENAAAAADDEGPAAPVPAPGKIEPQFPCYFDTSLVSSSAFAYEEKGAGIREPRLTTPAGEIVNQILRGECYELAFDVEFEWDCPGVRFYTLIRTPKGIDLAGCCYPNLSQPGVDVAAGTKLRLAFPFLCSLNPGTFFCNFAVQAIDGSLHHRIVDAMAFRVVANNVRPVTGIVDLGYMPTLRIVR